MYWTANREAGIFIESFETVEEARQAIIMYENKDKEDEIYEPDFYEVQNEEHETIYD